MKLVRVKMSKLDKSSEVAFSLDMSVITAGQRGPNSVDVLGIGGYS